MLNHNITLECISKYVGIYYSKEYTPEMSLALRDSLSKGQLYSKLKAVELAKEFIIRPGIGYFIGHWHGFLPLLYKRHGLIEAASGVELDQTWVDFSNSLNYDWDWKSRISDGTICKIPEESSIVVNTSCEHMTDEWLSLVLPGTLVVAQSTDYKHDTHINIVKSLDEFRIKFGSSFIIYSQDSTKYDVYSRYTIVALKK